MEYTIILADGRKLTNLGKNGDNFISKGKVDETIFMNNLSVMTVCDGKTETIYHNLEFIQQMEWVDGTYYLAFRKIPDEELILRRMREESERNQANIEYIAMMSGVNLDE